VDRNGGPMSGNRVPGHRRGNVGRNRKCIRQDGFDWTDLAGHTED